MEKFIRLMHVKKDSALEFPFATSHLALCPDLGGRTFAQVGGMSMHRIDLQAVTNPTQPFNNFGGGNFWPAPEGGKFAFNYRYDGWYVQPAINNQPFEVVTCDEHSALIAKQIELVNRGGTVLQAAMKRRLDVLNKLPSELSHEPIRAFLSYRTTDSFEIEAPVCVDQALLAAWTLEQFDATDHTVAFVVVDNPTGAVNYDFYDHPNHRIIHRSRGLFYQTDGKCKGQIGIKAAAKASRIGFYNRSKNLLCLRENLTPPGGLYFNIADNDQTGGPFSAADNYSIFNSDPDMAAFELETIGPADVQNNQLKGAQLISQTTFVVFESPLALEKVVSQLLDGPVL